MGNTRIDWEAIERDHATGQWTDIQLADLHKVSRETISRRRKKDQAADPGRWRKDLTEQVRVVRNAILLNEQVTSHVTQITDDITEKITSGAESVVTAAVMGAKVIMRHREDVDKARGVAMRMLGELDLTTLGADKIEEAFELLTADLDGKALTDIRQQFREFMRLHSRVGSVQKLMDAIAKAQTLERVAFNLDASANPADSTWESILANANALRLKMLSENATQ